MFQPLATRILSWLAWLLAGVTVLLCLYFIMTWSRLPELAKPAAPEAKGMPAAPAFSEDAWQVFARQPATGPSADAGPVAKRFRLAGTFFAFAEGGANDAENRRAILDDLGKAAQVLVSEGQDVEGYQVARVFEDHVVLRQGGMDTELWLSFSGSAGGAAAPAAGKAEPKETILETTRFGDRVGTNRWVISRDNLLGYYRELLDDPERIAALYMSLKPQYKDENITGYNLDVEGEGEFFKAMGFQQGDVIRKVNSINMTSQKRAEYFIGEFVKNRVNAFVLDVDRGGKQEKLIYLIR